MEENKITTIIKTKNSEQNLIKTLESVKNSNEIIIIDENSTDDTTEIAKAYRAKIVYYEKNNFENVFLNCLNETDSNWILFLKDDEVFQDKLFENLRNLINSKKSKKISSVYFPLKSHYFNKEFNIKSKKILRCIKKDFIEGFNEFSFEPILKKGKNYRFNKAKGAIYKYYEIDIEKNILNMLDENKQICKKEKAKNPSIFIKPFCVFLYWYFIKRTIFEGKIGFNFALLKAIKKYLLEIMYLEKLYREKENDI